MGEARTLHRHGEPRVYTWVMDMTSHCESVVDFGCGTGAYLRAAECPIRIGIDGFQPYIDEAKSDETLVGCDFYCADMRDYREIIGSGYDVAMFIDSLEHLPKLEAIELINQCKYDFQRIVTFIPIGTHDQGPCDGNDLQSHLSTWLPDDLELLGFQATVIKKFHYNNPPESQAAAFCVWNRR